MDTLVVEGTGRSILVLHGGMGDLSSWAKVTDRLRDEFRVARLHRRQYRLDVPRKVTMADEVAEVLAAAATLDRPVLVGHSSGAVLALESLVAAEPGLFAGAALYEPPLVIDDRRLGDGTQGGAAARSDRAQPDPAQPDPAQPDRAQPDPAQPGSAQPGSAQPGGAAGPPEGGGRPIDRARAAIAAGKPGTAFAVFLREIAGIADGTADAVEAALNQRPEIGPVVERQLDDNDAIDALGNRLDVYARIGLPVLLLTGDQSPRHLRERLEALRSVLPDARRATLHGQGHNAERSAPGHLAEVIGRFVAS